MGRKEDLMADYYSQKQHFAELLNGWIFHGKSQIPEDMRAYVADFTYWTCVTQRMLV